MRYRGGGKVELRIHEFLSLVFVCVFCGIQLISRLETSLNEITIYEVSDVDTQQNELLHSKITTIPKYEESVEGKTETFRRTQNTFSNTTTPRSAADNDDDDDDDDDWFQKTSWRPNLHKNKCFYVENLCHSSQVWFYDKQQTVDNGQQKPHQPEFLTVKLKRNFPRGNIGHKNKAYTEEIPIHSETPPNIQVAKCRYSPIINHMILHSDYNDMLGEFYSRTLMNVWQMVMEINDYHHDGELQSQEQSRNNSGQALFSDPFLPESYEYYSTLKHSWDESFSRNTQMYLHLDFHLLKYIPPVFESHRLFMDIFTNNPILNFRTLLDHGGCRCLKRAIFCGYGQDPTDPNGVVLAGSLRGIDFDKEGGKLSQLQQQGTRLIRDTLLHHMIDRNPLVQELIQTTRYAHLKRINVLDRNLQNLAVGSPELKTLLDEWTIIGFSQRTKRRKWLDATEVQDECNKRFHAYKIACVTVDIENYIWSTPLKHLAAHASLDGLIGIHGAQLTEALWLPRGSLVVELLPWIPNLVEGGWVKWVHRPTPLGVIYKGTDLNHIGYPLTLASANWYCTGENYTKHCFNDKKNQWGNRDFVVNITIVEDILTKFVLPTKSRNELPSCGDFVDRAADDYVLYNVHCVDEGTMGTHHYYREKDWISKKQAIAEPKVSLKKPKKTGK